MSLYYCFNDEQQEYIVNDNPVERIRFMYDLVTDSYIEDISTQAKENYLHNKYGRYGFAEFYHVLKELINEKYPHMERRVLSSGDYTFDEEMELRNGDKKIRYSAYAMYVMSVSPEDTIDSFMNILENFAMQTC